jgi:hypothetical protein
MTRKTKISCDVTREADNLLKAFCLKHERSKGFLIEKMIRTYCVEPEVVAKPSKAPVAKVNKEPVKRFVKPEISDVMSHFVEKGSVIEEAEKFFDFYESKGWVVGKSPMKNWQAAVGNWLRGQDSSNVPAGDNSLKTVADVLARLEKHQLTSIKQIPTNIKKFMDTQYRLKNYPSQTMVQLKNIGFE